MIKPVPQKISTMLEFFRARLTSQRIIISPRMMSRAIP